MKVAYDVTRKRPACAILQALLGGEPGVANLFPSYTWLIDLTPEMAVYEATDEQLVRLIEITEEEHERRTKAEEAIRDRIKPMAGDCKARGGNG